ncbi:MAG: OmpA family protein [Acidobacteriota bacterium]
MRIAGTAVILCLGAAASADPLEATGFFGGQYFSKDVGLGGSTFAEQRPQSSPLVGARVSVIALPNVAGDDELHLDLGLEGEVAMATAFTGYGFTSGRDSYFSPVFGWRGDLLVRLSAGNIKPHLVLGAGGASVRSSSPYMTKETVGELVWGLGVTFVIDQRWQLRFDGRQGLLPTMSGGTASTFEGSIGIGTSFGIPKEHLAPRHVEPPPERPAPPPDVDRDGDGIPDAFDQCPNEAETVNGITDDDGCPEQDPDGDGILGAADQCPQEAEDFDHFQDEDGCPDPDNDHDGIPDAHDACPNQPETVNGFEDEDGCPDTIPADLDAALAAATAVRFEAGKARVSNAAKKALERAVAMLRAHPTVHVTLTVHPDKADKADKAGELAKKRGESIKWYMQDEGVAAEQVTVVVSSAPVAAKGPTVELALPEKQ